MLYMVMRIFVNEDCLLGKTSGSCDTVNVVVVGGHRVHGAVASGAGHVTCLCTPTDKVISGCLKSFMIHVSELQVSSHDICHLGSLLLHFTFCTTG